MADPLNFTVTAGNPLSLNVQSFQVSNVQINEVFNVTDPDEQEFFDLFYYKGGVPGSRFLLALAKLAFILEGGDPTQAATMSFTGGTTVPK